MSSTAKGDSKIGERGAIAVEFALLTPIFLLILGLLVDFSRIGFVQISLNSAAREGVRASSFGIYTDTQIRDVAIKASSGAAGIAQLSTGGTLVVTPIGCASSTSSPKVTSVEVSTPFNWVTPIELFAFVGGSGSSVQNFTVRARGVMVCAG